MNIASANVMARQWAAAMGWQARLTPRNSAVVCSGGIDLPDPESLMSLPICSATVQQALAHLPPNIQTIGYAAPGPLDDAWYRHLAGTAVKRLVPLDRMHHFGPTWDGMPFWRQLFEEVEIGG
jgi:hypothetical protein